MCVKTKFEGECSAESSASLVLVLEGRRMLSSPRINTQLSRVTTDSSVTLVGPRWRTDNSNTMDDIDLDEKLRELEDSFKVRRERRKEQRLVMEEELEKSLKKDKSGSRDSLRVSVVSESEKSKPSHLVTDQEEKYIRELCETEKRIRELENVISGLNFELEKIDLAENTTLPVPVKPGHGFKVSTDI